MDVFQFFFLDLTSGLRVILSTTTSSLGWLHLFSKMSLSPGFLPVSVVCILVSTWVLAKDPSHFVPSAWVVTFASKVSVTICMQFTPSHMWISSGQASLLSSRLLNSSNFWISLFRSFLDSICSKLSPFSPYIQYLSSVLSRNLDLFHDFIFLIFTSSPQSQFISSPADFASHLLNVMSFPIITLTQALIIDS